MPAVTTRSRPRSSRVRQCRSSRVDQFGGGEHRVVAQPARHGAGMAGLADAFDGAMAQIAANAGDHRHRQVARHQHRALLDMQFEPGGDAWRDRAGARPARCASRRRRRRAIASPSVAAAADLRHRQVVGRQFAEQRRGADIGPAEPGAFLAAQGVELDGPRRREPSRAAAPAPAARRPPRPRRRNCRPAAPNRGASRRRGTAAPDRALAGHDQIGGGIALRRRDPRRALRPR